MIINRKQPPEFSIYLEQRWAVLRSQNVKGLMKRLMMKLFPKKMQVSEFIVQCLAQRASLQKIICLTEVLALAAVKNFHKSIARDFQPKQEAEEE